MQRINLRRTTNRLNRRSLPAAARCFAPVMSATRFVLTLALLSCVACTSLPAEPPAARVATYNIRLDTEADGDNAWPHRRREVVALLRFYAPDVLGLQEVRLHQLDYIRQDLDRYTFLGVGRDDGREGGEFSPLAFLSERFELMEHGTYWLSETPDRPSRGFDAAFPRIVSWARLMDRYSKKPLLLLNTHWDHVGAAARLASAQVVRDWIDANRRDCEAVILMGDFNATPDQAPIGALLRPGRNTLHRALAISEEPSFGPPGTYNDFDIHSARVAPIDHVFVSDDVRVARHAVITQHDEGRLPSDHYPVIADIALAHCNSGENDQ